MIIKIIKEENLYGCPTLLERCDYMTFSELQMVLFFKFNIVIKEKNIKEYDNHIEVKCIEYDNIKKEFYNYKKGSAGGFQTKLFDLFGVADEDNFLLLKKSFPIHYNVLIDFRNSPSEEDFFKNLLNN